MRIAHTSIYSFYRFSYFGWYFLFYVKLFSYDEEVYRTLDKVVFLFLLEQTPEKFNSEIL